ncbi:hypothetical protein FACS1894219_01230 [Clostridia bacterium]|nr:hypothetical protein FACS1894219_01230 [Clostridia bacterium]
MIKQTTKTVGTILLAGLMAVSAFAWELPADEQYALDNKPSEVADKEEGGLTFFSDIPYAEVAPTLDGIKEIGYSNPFAVANQANGEEITNTIAFVSTCWNGTTLYIYGKIYDETPQYPDNSNKTDCDNMEIKFDISGVGDGHRDNVPMFPYTINPAYPEKNVFSSAAFNFIEQDILDPTWTVFTSIDEPNFNWTFEVAIDLKGIQEAMDWPVPYTVQTLGAGYKSKIDFHLADCIYGTARDAQITINGSAAGWQYTDKIGGQFTWVDTISAPAQAVKDEAEAAEKATVAQVESDNTAAATPTPTPTAPKTADMGILIALAGLISAGGAMLASKKKK